jgi:hypothetical protein
MLFLTLLFIQNDVMWKKLDEFFKRCEHFSFCKCTKKHGIGTKLKARGLRAILDKGPRSKFQWN